MIEKTWHMSPHRRKIFIDMVVVGCFDFLEKIKLSGISVRVGCVKKIPGK